VFAMRFTSTKQWKEARTEQLRWSNYARIILSCPLHSLLCAVYCSCCNVLQCIAVCVAVCGIVLIFMKYALCCSAVCCSMLQLVGHMMCD